MMCHFITSNVLLLPSLLDPCGNLRKCFLDAAFARLIVASNDRITCLVDAAGTKSGLTSHDGSQDWETMKSFIYYHNYNLKNYHF